MSNEVWVTWEDYGRVRRHTIVEIPRETDVVVHLQKAFVKDRKLDIDHATVSVSTAENDSPLEADDSLLDYFVKGEPDDAKHSGRSRGSALFLKLPSQPQQQKEGNAELERSSFPQASTLLAAVKREVEKAVQKEVANKRRKNEAPERILSFVSKSHAFSENKIKGRISFGHDFFFDLVDAIETSAFERVAPDKASDENTMHHPYFLDETKILIKSALEKGINISQQLLWTNSGHWLSLDDRNTCGVEPDFSCTRVDTSRRGPDDDSQFYVSRKEDGVEKPSKYDVIITFEQKKEFVESDQIEAIDYAERILRVQRGRMFTFTALFHCCVNEKVIRWMKVSAADGHYVTEVSKPASLAPSGMGQRQLLTMLTKTPEELGLNVPNLGMSESGDDIKILSLLGCGATSDVYHGLLGDEKGVLKVLKASYVDFADHEANILDHLSRSGNPWLAKGLKVKRGVLFFHDILVPIKSLTSKQVADILSCLQHAHNEGVVHRDIRPDNIMEGADGSARIVDWGFAYMRGSEMPPFQGTFRFAGDEVLDAAIVEQAREPQPRDDLESFVRLVFAVSNVSLWQAVSRINDRDLRSAKAVWVKFREQNPRVSDMFEAAANRDYDSLRQILPGIE